MRQVVGRVFLIILCIIGVAGFVYVDSCEELKQTELELSFTLGEEIIHAHKEGEMYYLFLPSFAETKDVILTSYADTFAAEEKGLVIKQGDSLKDFSVNEVISCKRKTTGDFFSLCIMRSENLPAMFMQTDSGSLDAIWSDTEIEENGKMQLFSKNGDAVYTNGLKSIKSRGNYSFSNYEKKPFSIKTKEEVSLLGLGAGQKYILLSNASDPTLIRNDIARKMEAALDTEYDNIGRFLDLYVNGDYLGTYYLCESIEIGTERINVTDMEAQMDMIYQKNNYESYELYETENKRARYLDQNPDDITGGYLVEREFEDRYRLEYVENPSSFVTTNEEHFIVKSPLYCSVEQIDYLQGYFDEAEAAILSEDGINPVTQKSYEEYINVDSFVKKYLVEEVTKNYDGGISSVFFYKDSDAIDNRIKAAPIWDCDMSLGNYLDWMEYFAKDPAGVSRLSLHGHASPWYDALYQKDEYYQKVRKYYAEAVAPFMEKLTEYEIDAQRELLKASAAMNEIRWRVDFSNNQYYINQDTSFAQLKEFVAERKEFLDKAWIEEKPYYIVTFEKDEAVYAIQYLEENAVVTDLPKVMDENFKGWNYSGEKITKDTVITCK